MKGFRILGLAIWGLLFFAADLKAQKTLAYSDEYIDVKKGIALFEREEYASANAHFERAESKLPKAMDRNSTFIQSQVKFYKAVCATKLNYPNAEELLSNYLLYQNESEYSKSIHFHLATILFKKNEYSKVIEHYKLCNKFNLTKKEKEMYQFQNGYAYFAANNYEESYAYFKPLTSNSKSIYFEDAVYYTAVMEFRKKDYSEAEKGFLKIEKVDKYRYQIPYLLSQVYFQQKLYDKVIEYAEPKLAFSDQNIEAISHIVGQSYFEKGKYDKALPHLETYIEKHSRVTPEEMYQVAYAQYKTGRYKEAIKNFKELQLADGELAQNALYALADCYLRNNQKKEAHAAFASVAKYNFDKTIKEESEFNYGKLSYELGMDNEAITSLKNFIKNYPTSKKNTEAKDLLAEELIHTKNYPEAIELMEDFDEFSEANQLAFQKINYFYAVELYNDNKHEEALKHLDKSINNTSDEHIEGQATFLKAEIEFEKKLYKEAKDNYISCYQMMQKSGISNANYSNLKVLYGRAYCHYNLKEYNNAAIAFGKVNEELSITKDVEAKLKITPDALLRLGDCYFVLKNYEGARNAYVQVIDKKMSGSDYALLQKATLDGLLKDDQAKINTLNLLISNYKNSLYIDDAIYQLGSVYEEKTDYANAKLMLKRLVENYTNSNYAPKALIKLGLISYNENQMDQSLAYYKSVSDNYPNSPESEQALKVIKDIYISKGEAEKYIDYAESQPNGKKISASAQDSLLFEAGEEAFAKDDCNKTTQALTTYLNKFPNGYFESKAHFYRGECYYRDKKYDNAITDYEFVIKNEKSPYYEKVLLKSVFVLYNQKKDYLKSFELYGKIKMVATNKQNAQIASLGLMRSSFYAGKYLENIAYCDEIMNNKEFASDIQLEANYYRAKSLFETNQKEAAKPYLEQMVKKSSSEKGAESKYLLAVIENEKGNYEKSLDLAFELKDDFASYEKWVVKGFILIGDNYLKMNDFFQAKATMESLLSNYDGDKTLVAEAKAKLDEIEKAGKDKSKVDFK